MAVDYNKITKNTIFLYFRMLIIMGVSLYTTRVVLSTLGITDFGIYDVVASFVIMFGFINSALTSATQRFITFELGKVGKKELQKVFSISIIIHVGLSLLIFLLAESIGLWFLNNKMNIPLERVEAAFWVFQFTIFNIMLEIVKVPYRALIIAHERMSFFAYVSILEAILKLLAVYTLLVVSVDKLIAYSILIFIVSLITIGFYYFYNKKHYIESTFTVIWDKELVKKMLSFSGWSLIGGLAWVLMNNGINIMLNIFFGPAVNAARGISMQVNIAIGALINSFRTAVNPQIIKMYSSNNINEMKHLSLLSARYTFYLALLLILPLYLQIEVILNIWLKEVPPLTIELTKLILIFSLIQTFDMSFGTIFQAIGKIKENQILSGLTYLMVLPFGYMGFEIYSLTPSSIIYIQIVAVTLVAFVIKVYLLNKLADITYYNYFFIFLYPIMKVIIVVFILNLIIMIYMENTIGIMIMSVVSVFLGVYFFDMNKQTRSIIIQYITNRLSKINLLKRDKNEK